MKQINPITLKNIHQITTKMLQQKNIQFRIIKQCKDSSTSDREGEMYNQLFESSDKKFMKLQKELFDTIDQLREDQ